MKFEEIITNRYSARKYTDQKVAMPLSQLFDEVFEQLA